MNINETKQFVAGCDLANKAPLIEGVHGIGKSEIIRQYSKENNLHCETLILSLMDVGDLIGLPRTIEAGGTLSTAWSAPDWYSRVVNAAMPTTINVDDLAFKSEDFQNYVMSYTDSATIDRADLNKYYCDFVGVASDQLHIIKQDLVSYTKAKRSVVFLDEFNRAPVDILNASLQLVLDKRLHSHILPVVNGKPTLVIAAINPDGEDYTVNSFDPALLDRFVHGKTDPDAKSWLDWARTTNINQVVRDFIAEHPDRIHWTPKNGGLGATPRSWTSLAQLVDNFKNIPEETHFHLMKGCIGQELASQFLSYYNHYSKVIKVEDIEKLVKTKSKRTKNPEKIGEHINKLIKDQEAIQKTELAENMYIKYMSNEKAADTLPFMSLLYGLDLEILNSFLKNKHESDVKTYMKLAKFDLELNNKELFRRITTKIN